MGLLHEGLFYSTDITISSLNIDTVADFQHSKFHVNYVTAVNVTHTTFWR